MPGPFGDVQLEEFLGLRLRPCSSSSPLHGAEATRRPSHATLRLRLLLLLFMCLFVHSQRRLSRLFVAVVPESIFHQPICPQVIV